MKFCLVCAACEREKKLLTRQNFVQGQTRRKWQTTTTRGGVGGGKGVRDVAWGKILLLKTAGNAAGKV